MDSNGRMGVLKEQSLKRTRAHWHILVPSCLLAKEVIPGTDIICVKACISRNVLPTWSGKESGHFSWMTARRLGRYEKPIEIVPGW